MDRRNAEEEATVLIAAFCQGIADGETPADLLEATVDEMALDMPLIDLDDIRESIINALFEL